MIYQLIRKFMEGQTTPDEERWIAHYFRSHVHLPADLELYRDMFAYFDGGMEQGVLPDFDGVKPQQNTKHHYKAMRSIWLCAVAAAVALLLVVVIPHRSELSTPDIASTDIETIDDAQHDVAKTDSLPSLPTAVPIPQQNVPMPQQKKSRTVTTKNKKHLPTGTHRHHYYMAPPKTYYADVDMLAHPATNESEASSVANAAMAAINQKCVNDELQRQQRTLAEIQQIINTTRENLVASGDFIDDDAY